MAGGAAGARNRRALLVALGADNFGSGLFLPLALVYATRGVGLPLATAILYAVGQQLFYSSVFSLVSGVAGHGPKERPVAVVNMVRSACFGLGGLAAGGLLTALVRPPRAPRPARPAMPAPQAAAGPPEP